MEDTRPELCSTQTAFFLRSIWTEPAREAVIVDGGTCRRPGPIFIGMKELGGIGRASTEILSPGRTSVVMIVKAVKDGAQSGIR